LFLIERLPAEERAALESTLPGGTYGVLKPTDDRGPQKVVGTDTALLFLTLLEPSEIPSYVHGTLGADAADAVAELVADGILEMEVDGVWASGPAAFQTVPHEPSEGLTGGPAARSLRALRAAAALPTAGAEWLTSFLYRYGTAPVTPARARQWLDSEAIRTSLQLVDISRPMLSEDRAWWVFAGDAGTGEEPCPKLYAGITIGSLKEALLRIGALFREHADTAPAFKLGATLQGLHRPDRLVFYPASPRLAEIWADRLVGALSDLAADPVPFTAAVDQEGRVSRGTDPPRSGRDWWQDDGSWRSTVTRTLGTAMAAARRAGEREPWVFALERVRLSGVDPERWIKIGSTEKALS
jgi:hypothetical protein